MALQSEDAVLNVRVNGEPAAASIKEMTGQIKYLTTAIEGMHKADNPGLYASRVAQLRALTAARDAERASINQTTVAVKEQASVVSNSFNSIKASVGIGILAVAALTKVLFDFTAKASGIEQAFSKIANTTGLLEEMRVASRGLISDLDLEKIAIKANNANIPMGKMGMLLAFAAQRARDTGEDVTVLTEKLITGLGKGGTRSLAGLGISVKEVKEEFKKTGDMVQAVSNIITRSMQKNGEDVETFGDVWGKVGTFIKNIWKDFSDGVGKVFTPWLADPKDVETAKNREIKQFGDIEKLKDDELKKAIENQEKRVQIFKGASTTANKLLKNLSYLDKINANNTEAENASKRASDYQGARNALQALLHEQDSRTVKSEIGEDADAKAEKAREKALRELAQYQSQLESARDQLDQLIAKSTKGSIEGLDAQLKVIDDKYQKIIAKLKQLNASKFATGDDKKKNNSLIAAAGIADKNEQDNTRDDFNYKADEKLINDDAKRRADKVKQDEAAGLIGKEKLADEEYKIEQKRLQDLYELQVIYGAETVDTEKLNADNEIKQKQRVHDQALKLLKEQMQVEKDFARAKEQIEAAKQSLAMTTFGTLNAIFGKNKALLLAELALDKVIAIGKIEAAEGVEIAEYWAKYAALPGGEVIAGVLSAAAVTRANLSIAGIIIAGIGEAVGDLSSGGKKYSDGGFLPDGPGHSSGGMNIIGPYGRAVGNIEGGEPILSRSTYANNRGVVDALLQSRGGPVDYERINRATTSRDLRGTGNPNQSAKGGSVTPGQQIDIGTLIQEVRRVGDIMDKKQLSINRRAWDTEAEKVVQIRSNANG